MKSYTISLLAIIGILSCRFAIADNTPVGATARVSQNNTTYGLPESVVMDALQNFFGKTAPAAKNKYATLMLEKYDARRGTLELNSRELSAIFVETCKAGGLDMNTQSGYDQCNYLVSTIMSQVKTFYNTAGTALCGTRAKDPKLKDGTKITQGAPLGLDYCHFLNDNAPYANNTIVEKITQYVKSTITEQFRSINCPIDQGLATKDLVTGKWTVITIPSPSSVTFSDMPGTFRIFRCTINNRAAPSYFVFGTDSRVTNYNQNFNPSTDKCAALPWDLNSSDYVQVGHVLHKDDYEKCTPTIEWLKSECSKYTGDNGHNCIYNHPITKREFKQEVTGTTITLRCDVSYDQNKPCQFQGPAVTRTLNSQCSASDLPPNATYGVYTSAGAQKYDCKTSDGRIVKCNCAARECNSAKGYTLATNNSGASLGYCTLAQATPNARPSIDLETIDNLAARPAGPIPTSGPSETIEPIKRVLTPTEQAASDRCTATMGQFDVTTNSCACDINLHMIVMKNSAGMSFCTCDYNNGYIASDDGRSCVLTQSAQRRLDRQQRRDERRAKNNPPAGSGSPALDELPDPIGDRESMILGNEMLYK